MWRVSLRAMALIWVMLCLPVSPAQAACSPATGSAVLNEYYFGTSNPPGNFLEIFSTDPAFTTGAWQGWSIDVYSAPNTKLNYALNAALPNVQACVFGSKTFVTHTVAGGLVASQALVILRDPLGNPADALVFDNNNNKPFPWPTAATSYYPALATECPALAAQLDAQAVNFAATPSQMNMLRITNYGNKDLARFPDGTGTWDVSSNQGAGTTFSQCGSNSPTLIKTSNVATVNPGGTVIYTVQFKNGGKTALNGVTISDQMPSNWAFVPVVTVGTLTVVGQTITWVAGNIAAGATATMTVTATVPVTEVPGVYTNTATTTAGLTVPQTDFATVTVNKSVGRFNAFESATPAGAITGVIQTKVAGAAFALDVVGINAGTQATTFTGAVKVELLGNSAAGVALDANNCPLTSTILQTVLPDPALNGGRATVNFSAVPEAWRDVRVRVSYPVGAPTVASCSSDNFAIRPNVLQLSVTDGDWLTAGVARTLNNVATASPGCRALNTPLGCTGAIHKAGRPFSMTITAQNALGATTTQYAGQPAQAAVICTAPAGCVNGVLTPGIWSGAAGVSSTTTATYSEVGNLNLTLQDTTFAAVDAADGTPASCAGYFICSPVTAVGRFVPDHFAMTLPSLQNRADLVCAASPFNYLGEKMNALMMLTAQSASNTTTQNYTGILAKLNPAAAGNPLGFGAVDSTLVPTFLSARLDTTLPAAGSFVAGVANITAPLALTRGAMPDGPYAVLDIGIAPQEGDGIGMAAFDLDADAAIAGNDHTKLARTEVRYGQLKIANAHGSELLKLPMPVSAQYWNGTFYTTNISDSCTRLNATTVTATNWTNLAPGNWQKLSAASTWAAGATQVVPATAVILLSNGVGSFTLAAPGANKTGSVDISNNAPVYLPLTNPARATFGVYRGTNEFIYLRESY